MKTIVLVGAGATLAEALPSKPARDRVPPLDTTFFELCRLANLKGRRRVKKFMIESYGVDPFSGDYRMEEVFNFVYSDAFSSSPPDGCFDAYWNLLRMYAAAIGRTTDTLVGSGRRGVGALWIDGVSID